MKKWLSENRMQVARGAGSLLAIFLLVFLFREESGADILDAIRRISIVDFLAAGLLMLVSRLFLVGRWHILLRSGGVKASFRNTMMLTFTGLFSSNFLPTTIGGDVVRLAGAMQIGFDRAVSLASLVADRLVGMFGMAVTLPFGLIPIFSLSKPLQAFTFGDAFNRLWGFAKRMLDAFAIWLKKPAALSISFLYTFGNMACIFGAIYFLIIGMDHRLSYWLIAGLWGVTYFVTLIPISINGYGVQELSLTFLLTRIGGLSQSESLTIAVLIRILFIATSLPGAFFLPSILAAMTNRPVEKSDASQL